VTKCELCGVTKNLIGHHTNYEKNETVWLCKGCHRKVHGDPFHSLYPSDEPPVHTASTRITDRILEMIQHPEIAKWYVSTSDFLRDAVKFYIKEHWPDIYAKYSGETLEE